MSGTAYLVDGLRTPFGSHGGSLASVRTDDLAAHVIAKLLERTPVPKDRIDDVIFGCANQAGEDNRNVARMALLLAGLPVSVPGITVNRLCGSGLQAIADGARQILTGEADLILAGGVEGMTRSPFVMGKLDTAFGRGNQVAYDTTLGWRFPNPRMEAMHGTLAMGETAEKVAERERVSREAQDAFALESQTRAQNAIKAGHFDREIAPIITGKDKKSGADIRCEIDEHPRAVTADGLAKLKPVFKRDGTVTAGNSSGINDGAAVLLLASEKAVKEHGLKPMARYVTSATAGVEPSYMGLGPIPASKAAWKKAGLAAKEMDVTELNEAFAAQALPCIRDLALDPKRVNPNGGAIALGHPLGASGARMTITLANELARRNGRYGLASMCIGVGQGIAVIIERV
jgi:3-oxoadipyl-CoA thiolase